MIPLSFYPVHLTSVVSDIINGEALILAPDQGKVSVLNEVASRIWYLSDGTRTIDDIGKIISHEYEVSYNTAIEDICSFLGTLIQKEVLEVLPSSPQNLKETSDSSLNGTE